MRHKRVDILQIIARDARAGTAQTENLHHVQTARFMNGNFV